MPSKSKSNSAPKNEILWLFVLLGVVTIISFPILKKRVAQTSQAPEISIPTSKTYTDSRYGFEFTYPSEGFVRVTDNTEGPLVTYQGPTNDFFHVSANEPLVENRKPTLESWLARFKEQGRRIDEYELQDVKGYLVTASSTKSIFIYEKEDTVFILGFDSYDPKVDQSITSKILGSYKHPKLASPSP